MVHSRWPIRASRKPPLFTAIKAKVIALRPALVVFDNIAASFSGNQNAQLREPVARSGARKRCLLRTISTIREFSMNHLVFSQLTPSQLRSSSSFRKRSLSCTWATTNTSFAKAIRCTLKSSRPIHSRIQAW